MIFVYHVAKVVLHRTQVGKWLVRILDAIWIGATQDDIDKAWAGSPQLLILVPISLYSRVRDVSLHVLLGPIPGTVITQNLHEFT